MPDKIESIAPEARKMRDFYEMKPNAPLVHTEFGFYCTERWIREGAPADQQLWPEFFGYDPYAVHSLGNLGWCEAAMSPAFEKRIVEDRGDTEVEIDFAGRHVLYFKNRRSGFMPEYIGHPVRDLKSWRENVQWRLDPATPARWSDLSARMEAARQAAARGSLICQNLIGGYMYLRSLIGPEELLYKFYDDPALLHECMAAWLALADAVTARHQEFLVIDELFLAEDICYNHGSLISPDQMKDFLFPYYRQLLAGVKARQPGHRLYVQVDTDGFADPVIPLYREAIGMNVMSPFEVASKCDVVRTGREYPDLRLRGGIDKRILAAGPDAIDRELERIIPAMMARGGYIPTCDHGVPEEVSLANYLHYRRRMREYSH